MSDLPPNTVVIWSGNWFTMIGPGANGQMVSIGGPAQFPQFPPRPSR